MPCLGHSGGICRVRRRYSHYMHRSGIFGEITFFLKRASVPSVFGSKTTPGEQSAASDSAFSAQVNAQTERITAELNKLGQLLQAGMVDRRVLVAFREAVNRIRLISWGVQQWLEGGESGLQTLLLKERIRIAEQLTMQLSEDLTHAEVTQDLGALRQAVEKLSTVLRDMPTG